MRSSTEWKVTTAQLAPRFNAPFRRHHREKLAIFVYFTAICAAPENCGSRGGDFGPGFDRGKRLYQTASVSVVVDRSVFAGAHNGFGRSGDWRVLRRTDKRILADHSLLRLIDDIRRRGAVLALPHVSSGPSRQ